MASYLVDTNILLRLCDTRSQGNSIAARAIASLFHSGHEVYVTTQNLIEFWAVATRPLEANGLGQTIKETVSELARVRSRFPLLPDNPAILGEWMELVTQHRISGKRTHDARLLAVLKVHRIDHLLTFNGVDFPMVGQSIVSPQDVLMSHSGR